MRGAATDQDIRVALVAGYLAEYATIWDQNKQRLAENPQIFDIFEKALEDVPVELLRWALSEYSRIGKKFPAPGDIRELVRRRQGEEAWEKVRQIVKEFYYGEDGFRPLYVSKETRIGPRLSAISIKTELLDGYRLEPIPFDRATSAAIERLGGLRVIHQLATGNDFEFARRNFAEAYTNFHSNHEALLPPSREEAQKMLEGLKEKA